MMSHFSQLRLPASKFLFRHSFCTINNFGTIAITEYYRKVATVYDAQLSPYISAVTNCILRYFPIDQNDVIVDIGAGTGEIAHQIWKQAQLKNHILCVDPSQEMLQVASKKEGLDTLQATAEDFFSPKLAHISFNKVFMCGCTHLFKELVSIFTNLKERLPTDGACIVTYGSLSPLPLKIIQNYNQRSSQTEEDSRKLISTLGLKGRQVEVTEKVPTLKSVWYDTLRSRGLYSTTHYSDDQLEEGILEMEKHFDIGDQETLTVEANIKAIILTKS